MSGVVLILVLLIIVFTVYAGVRDGAFFTTYSLLRNLFAFIFAMTLAEPLAGLCEKLFSSGPRGHPYFVIICFAGAYGIVFVTARQLKMKYTTPYVECPNAVDYSMGPILGLVNGVVVTGTLLVMWSLLPFAKYIPADQGRVEVKAGALDTGDAVLKFYSFAKQRLGGRREFLLHDELVTVDRNHNGRADPGDGYVDADKNGQWDRGWLWRYHNHAAIGETDIEPLGVLERKE